MLDFLHSRRGVILVDGTLPRIATALERIADGICTQSMKPADLAKMSDMDLKKLLCDRSADIIRELDERQIEVQIHDVGGEG